jgi:hypothetical protein
VYVCTSAPDTFIQRERGREERERINDTCKRPVEFPRCAIFDDADGIRGRGKQERGRRGVWGFQTEKGGLMSVCVCVCV